MSNEFQAEIRFLGMVSSPVFARQPDGNGCVERFMRTLKEHLVQVHTFRNIEELQAAIMEFRQRYNEQWFFGRNGFRSPRQVWQDFLVLGTAA